jgi:hypothetical protein
MIVRSVCDAGVRYKAEKIFIIPTEGIINIYCNFGKCAYRNSNGCACAGETEAPATILGVDVMNSKGEKKMTIKLGYIGGETK